MQPTYPVAVTRAPVAQRADLHVSYWLDLLLALLLAQACMLSWHLRRRLHARSAATPDAGFPFGASRVVLHAHFAADVLAGFASGGAWLFACLLGLEMHRDWVPVATPWA